MYSDVTYKLSVGGEEDYGRKATESDGGQCLLKCGEEREGDYKYNIKVDQISQFGHLKAEEDQFLGDDLI